ncbi:stress-response A/B barrel domain-containing protein HS1-like [Fagus crenata]
MEEAKGVVKHIFLAKFKDGTTPNQIDHLIREMAKLVHLIEPMKGINFSMFNITKTPTIPLFPTLSTLRTGEQHSKSLVFHFSNQAMYIIFTILVKGSYV